MSDWLQQNEALLWWLGIFSIASLVASAAALPWVVCRIPVDYFCHRERHPARRHPVAVVAKNLLGGLLLVVGLALLVLPVQGLLTMFVGMLLMDFPGKFTIERKLVARPAILRGLNWLRAKRGVPPLRVESE